jgi:CPA2 family monovalent cation:H+ antiporter-2
MAEFEFLKSLVVILGLAGVIVYALDRVKVPSIVGFLAAGLLLGPSGLELIRDRHLVEIFAEIGVILLLFTIGLEFSLKQLLKSRRSVLLGGFLQVSITSLVVLSVFLASGRSLNVALLFSFLISMSSTAIVMRMLFERAEMDAPHGRVSVGILIFQDLCVVFFMLMIPILAGKDRDIAGIGLILLKSFAIIIAVVLSARWLVPKVLHQIVHTRKRELFIITVLVICLGTAFLTFRFGLSLAIGAFIAGLVISESEYSYQALSDIIPFKDSFNGLFFISIGMLLDVRFLIDNIAIISIIIAAVILLKIITTTTASLLTGNSFRISIQSGLVLAQIGEFSFVLSVAAMKAGLMDEQTYQYFLSAAIVTMILTPLFIGMSHRMSQLITPWGVLSRIEREGVRHETIQRHRMLHDHVIIIGFGLNGRNLALVLKEIEVPYVILELNSQTVMESKKSGEPIVYGDGTSQDILRKLHIEKARALIIAISDPTATRKIVKIAKDLKPSLHIIVRTRYMAEIGDLNILGADDVVPEEFETSIELFSRVLNLYNMPKDLIELYQEGIRKNNYELLLKRETTKQFFRDTAAIMPGFESKSFIVERGSHAIGKSIQEMQIRSRAGGLVIAVRRDNDIIKGPGPDFRFTEGDNVLIVGEMVDPDILARMFSPNDTV